MSTTEIRDLALQLPPGERTVLARDLLASVETGASQMKFSEAATGATFQFQEKQDTPGAATIADELPGGAGNGARADVEQLA